jgi:peptidoglycan/LPS O-acetylase OafA/YrhL
MTATLTGVLFVAAALFSAGLLAAVWRRDLGGAIAGLPAMGAGAAVAAAGASRFAPSSQAPAAGQELAVLIAVATLALVVLGAAMAGPARARSGPAEQAPSRRRGRGNRR